MSITIHLRGDVPILAPNGKIVGPAGIGIARKTRFMVR